MGGFIPDQRSPGHAMTDINADRPPRREKIHEVADYEPGRSHQRMTGIVDHTRENHPIYQSPNEKQKIAKEQPRGPICGEQRVGKLAFWIEEAAIKLKYCKVGQHKVGKHHGRAGDHTLAVPGQEVFRAKRSLPAVLLHALKDDTQQPARPLSAASSPDGKNSRVAIGSERCKIPGLPVSVSMVDRVIGIVSDKCGIEAQFGDAEGDIVILGK